MAGIIITGIICGTVLIIYAIGTIYGDKGGKDE